MFINDESRYCIKSEVNVWEVKKINERLGSFSEQFQYQILCRFVMKRYYEFNLI